jgi:hypothetical protein
MNMKQIGLLSALAALSVGAAALSMSSGPQGFASDKRGQLVFPGLTQKANDVTSITIRDFERSFTVERREDGFYNKESGYPVKPDAFRDLVAGRVRPDHAVEHGLLVQHRGMQGSTGGWILECDGVHLVAESDAKCAGETFRRVDT